MLLIVIEWRVTVAKRLFAPMADHGVRTDNRGGHSVTATFDTSPW